jgi:putative alpha-1,2-mannosidase
MAKAVADTNSGSNQGGFTLDGSPITGFSSMHDSGTGGDPSLGNFALFPYTSCVNDTVDGCTYPKLSRPVGFDNSSVVATPGYFALTLDTGIKVDMTTARHTSLFRFQFPTTDSPESPLILMDLTDLSDSRQDNATIDVDESSGRMTGSGRFLPSFGSSDYIAYFCADFQSASGVRDNGIFVNSRATSEAKSLKISRSINGYPLPVRIRKKLPCCLSRMLTDYSLRRVVRGSGSMPRQTHQLSHVLASA